LTNRIFMVLEGTYLSVILAKVKLFCWRVTLKALKASLFGARKVTLPVTLVWLIVSVRPAWLMNCSSVDS
jgi:hypothetical protein